MKKFIKYSVVAACAVAMMATGALAGTLTVGLNVGKTAVDRADYRLVAAGAYAVGAAAYVNNASLKYVPSVIVLNGSTIRFTLAGGVFPAGAVYDLRVAGAGASVATGTGDGTANLTLLVGGANLALGAVHHLEVQTGVGTWGPPSVTLNAAQAVGSAITVAVTQVFNVQSGQEIPLAVAPAVTWFTLGDGISVDLQDTDPNTINVEEERKEFTAGAGIPDTATSSDFTLQVKLDGDTVSKPVVPAGTDTWSLSIIGNLTGVKSLGVGGAAVDLTQAERDAGIVTRTGTEAGVAFAAGAITVTMNLFTGADAVVLSTRDFLYDFTYSQGTLAWVSVNDSKLLSWDINGAQFFVTDLKQSGRRTNLMVTNTNANAGAATLDVYADGVVYDSIALGDLEGNTSTLFTGGAIADAIEAAYPDFDATNFAGVITVIAPKADIFVEAFQMTGNGTRHGVPVDMDP